MIQHYSEDKYISILTGSDWDEGWDKQEMMQKTAPRRQTRSHPGLQHHEKGMGA